MATHCPHCGAPLPPRAVSCRECGSDAETGWSDDVDYHSVELPEAPLPSGPGDFKRTVAVLCAVMLLGGAIFLLDVQAWKALLVIAIVLPLAWSARRGGPEQ